MYLYIKWISINLIPEPTSMGGGYSCQVCGTTYETEQLLIEHGSIPASLSYGEIRSNLLLMREVRPLDVMKREAKVNSSMAWKA